jgi:hypothetical protein
MGVFFKYLVVFQLGGAPREQGRHRRHLLRRDEKDTVK